MKWVERTKENRRRRRTKKGLNWVLILNTQTYVHVHARKKREKTENKYIFVVKQWIKQRILFATHWAMLYSYYTHMYVCMYVYIYAWTVHFIILFIQPVLFHYVCVCVCVCVEVCLTCNIAYVFNIKTNTTATTAATARKANKQHPLSRCWLQFLHRFDGCFIDPTTDTTFLVSRENKHLFLQQSNARKQKQQQEISFSTK